MDMDVQYIFTVYHIITIHQLMGNWIVSIFQLLQKILLWKFMYKIVVGSMWISPFSAAITEYKWNNLWRLEVYLTHSYEG